MSHNDVGLVLVIGLAALPLAFFAYCCIISGLGMFDTQDGDGPPSGRGR